MNNLRFRATLSPFYFRELWAKGYLEPEDISFLKNVFAISSELKNSMVLIFPADFKTFLYQDGEIRVRLLAMEEDLQSNIFFLGFRKEEICTDDNVSNQFLSGSEEGVELLIHRKIINIIFQRKIPVLFDATVRNDSKRVCNLCEDPNVFCTFGFDFETHRPLSVDSLKEFLHRHQTALTDFIKGLTHPTLPMLKYTALLCSVFLNVPVEKLVEINSIDCVDEFLNDLRGISVEDFKELSYSAFRAFAFPSIGDAGRADPKFSVDYHSNTPNRHDGVELLRCDVVELERNGRGNSGVRRLLIGRKNGRKVLLGYTNAHDFSREMIAARTRSLNER